MPSFCTFLGFWSVYWEVTTLSYIELNKSSVSIYIRPFHGSTSNKFFMCAIVKHVPFIYKNRFQKRFFFQKCTLPFDIEIIARKLCSYLMVRAAASGWKIWWICRQSVTLFWLVINRNKRTSNMALHFFYFCAESCLWIVRNGLVCFNWILCEMWSVIMIWDKLWWRAGDSLSSVAQCLMMWVSLSYICSLSN